MKILLTEILINKVERFNFLYLVLLSLAIPSLANALQAEKAIDMLFKEESAACSKTKKVSKYATTTQKVIVEQDQIISALRDIHCRKIKSPIPIPKETNTWLTQFYYEANAKIALKKRDFKSVVQNKLALIDFQSDLQLKESALISLRSAIDKHRYPKLHQKIQNKITEISPRYISKPLPSQYIKVARDHKRNRDFKKAIYYLDKAWRKVKLSPQKNMQVSLELTELIKSKYGYRKYLPKTQKFIRYFGNPKTFSSLVNQNAYFKHSVNYIRGIWTIGRSKEALKNVNALIKRMPSYDIAYLNWLKALILKDLGQIANHRKTLKLALINLQTKPTENFSKIIFDVSQSAYNSLDLELYDMIMKLNLDKLSYERDRQYLIYWHAKLLDKKKEFAKAKVKYLEAIAINPFDFYALLASKRANFIPKIAIKDYVPKNTKLKIPDNLWFLRLTSKVLQDYYLNHLEYGTKSFKEGLLIAYIMQEEKLFYESFQFLFKFPQEQLLKALKEYPKIFYPLAFEKHLEDIPIDKLMALAIIKRESLFNPNAQSSANALGLMQVLPKVGKQTNRKLIKKSRDLFNIDKNIKTGTKFFSQVLKRFDNNFPLTIAAYNAGPRRVKIWKKKGIFDNELDENIEKIPYGETKNYVKKVLRNYLNYQRIYSKKFTLKSLDILDN